MAVLHRHDQWRPSIHVFAVDPRLVVAQVLDALKLIKCRRSDYGWPSCWSLLSQNVRSQFDQRLQRGKAANTTSETESSSAAVLDHALVKQFFRVQSHKKSNIVCSISPDRSVQRAIDMKSWFELQHLLEAPILVGLQNLQVLAGRAGRGQVQHFASRTKRRDTVRGVESWTLQE